MKKNSKLTFEVYSDSEGELCDLTASVDDNEPIYKVHINTPADGCDDYFHLDCVLQNIELILRMEYGRPD